MKTSTVALFSAVPVNDNVWSLVNSSVELEPVSVEILATTGAFGAVMSISTLNALEVELVLPAASVASGCYAVCTFCQSGSCVVVCPCT